MRSSGARGLARVLLGTACGLLSALWLATLRVEVRRDPALDALPPDRPWVLAFFHGALFPLLAWKRRRTTAVMVSHSNDGTLLARTLALLGMEVVRGSSSRGGARGLARLVRLLRAGQRDVAFAVDGPRGPRGVAKPGAVLAARTSGGVLVPMAAAVANGRVFRSWDRFVLPWPFSRVVVVLGEPAPTEGDDEALSTHIAAAQRRAEAILAG